MMTLQMTATYNNITIASRFYTCDFNTALNHITQIARRWMAARFSFSDWWNGENKTNDTITITISSFVH